LLSRYLIVEDFFRDAEQMRACLDRHFGDPDHSGGSSHQIWDYWHVPGLYTYLRTDPRRMFPPALLDQFLNALRFWALEVLGLDHVPRPYLSLYVDGCGQGLHNDAGNGRWGFVYSLTRWEQRRFVGGETLIFKDIPYWETEAMRYPGAGLAFYDLIPARFNQLLVFDDRLVHAVLPLQGNMAPTEGRLVIHGHIRDGGIHITGALSIEQIEKVLSEAQAYIRSRMRSLGTPFSGCVCVRITVASDGSVASAVPLTDRVCRTGPHAPDPSQLIRDIVTFLASLRFPQAAGKSVVTIPVSIE
jgi:hypothetical protein